MEPENTEPSRFKKMARSLSFRFPSQLGGGKRQEPKLAPKKLITEDWLKEPPGGQGRAAARRQEDPPQNIRVFNSVGDKMSLWATKVESHEKKQALNPFSDKFDKNLSRNLLSKDDPNYGRPDANSLSSMRARAGEARMRAEICDVCDVIFHHGQKSGDGTSAIMFGVLFSIYNRINDKVVGLLIRARRKGLLHFQGEMLYQRQDDEEWIVLTKNINTIRAIFGRDSDVPGGGEVDPQVQHDLVFGGDDRKGSNSSVTSLPARLPQNISCAALLGSSAIAIAGAAILKGEENRSLLLNQASSPIDAPRRPSLKPPTRSLRESFRRLMRPIVRRAEAETEPAASEELDEDEDSLDSLVNTWSRRGSGVSSTKVLQGDGINPSARWRRILGVSLAISRMAQLSKSSSDSTRALNRTDSLT